MATIRNWIYTNPEQTEKVLFSELTEQEQKEVTLRLNVTAMEQAGYERTA